ncbi:VirB8/TrbF family protein [Cellulomonas sp. P24]|uniref:VirB8/TrbF family protein n=1 Tax=Cellulomonas sp. P24 TaxID=2885206 RepID=UPI0037BFA8A8
MPRAIFTRVSNWSDNRAARSSRALLRSPARGRRGAAFGSASPPSVTISSVARTDRPSATIRWASRSIAAPSTRPRRARA